MKDRAVETTRRHIRYLAAAAAVIALAVAFTLTGGGANAQNPLELNFESINYTVREPAVDGARTNFEVGVLLSAESQTAVTVDFHTEAPSRQRRARTTSTSPPRCGSLPASPAARSTSRSWATTWVKTNNSSGCI